MPVLPDDPPPFFDNHVFVCTNRRPDDHPFGSCAAAGSEGLRDYLKAKAKAKGLKGVRVSAAGCLGRCDKAPVVVIYPEGVWYQPKTEADVDAILDSHLAEGGRASHLLIR